MKKFICVKCGGPGRAINHDAPWARLGLCLDCWGQAADSGELKIVNSLYVWAQARNEVNPRA